jgi:hypothetical protein
MDAGFRLGSAGMRLVRRGPASPLEALASRLQAQELAKNRVERIRRSLQLAALAERRQEAMKLPLSGIGNCAGHPSRFLCTHCGTKLRSETATLKVQLGGVNVQITDPTRRKPFAVTGQ